MNGIQVIELNNQRLLTTEQLAEFYKANENQIKVNFNRNKEKFVQGKHFHQLTGEELKKFKDEVTNSNLVGKNASQLILWTKQGASRHSKMLGTDKAWDMFDELEENYFSIKQQLPLSIRAQAMLALAANEETNVRVDLIEIDLKKIKENSLITTEDKNSIDRIVKRKVYSYCKDRDLKTKAKSMLFQDIGRSIKEMFNIPHRGRIKLKDFEAAIEFISDWEPSAVTKAKIKQIND